LITYVESDTENDWQYYGYTTIAYEAFRVSNVTWIHVSDG